MSKDERIRQDLREQTPRERLEEHAGRLAEISAQANFGLFALTREGVDEPAIREAYRRIIAEAEEAKRLISERLAKGQV